jgi:hypothetical protein
VPFAIVATFTCKPRFMSNSKIYGTYSKNSTKITLFKQFQPFVCIWILKGGKLCCQGGVTALYMLRVSLDVMCTGDYSHRR